MEIITTAIDVTYNVVTAIKTEMTISQNTYAIHEQKARGENLQQLNAYLYPSHEIVHQSACLSQYYHS